MRIPSLFGARLVMVCAVLAVAGAVHAHDADPFEGSTSLSLWIQPVGTAFMATADEGLYLPLGANVRTSENFDVQVEGTLLSTTRMPEGSNGRVLSRGFAFSVGPLFRRRMFFLTPKVLFARQTDVVQPAQLDEDARQFSAVLAHFGADVGMEIRSGALMLGFAAGASIGACRGCASVIYSPFGALDGGPIAGPNRSFSPSLGLNVNLFRLGAAF